MSARLSADVRTRTRICPSAGSGVGRSWTSSTSGPPGRVMITALIGEKLVELEKEKPARESRLFVENAEAALPHFVAGCVPDLDCPEIPAPNRSLDLGKIARHDDDEVVRSQARGCHTAQIL